MTNPRFNTNLFPTEESATAQPPAESPMKAAIHAADAVVAEKLGLPPKVMTRLMDTAHAYYEGLLLATMLNGGMKIDKFNEKCLLHVPELVHKLLVKMLLETGSIRQVEDKYVAVPLDQIKAD